MPTLTPPDWEHQDWTNGEKLLCWLVFVLLFVAIPATVYVLETLF